MNNREEIIIALQTGQPLLLWGGPGTGKTSWALQMAKLFRRPIEVVIASIREPSDFAGLPILTDHEVALAPPNWAKRLAQNGSGILFLDELSTAPPAVQSAALRVVQDRVVGDLELPEDVWIVAAANPTDTSSGTWLLSAALANRFIHIDWDVEAIDWTEGMLNGWQANIKTLPEKWREQIPFNVALIASFIKHRPSLLFVEPKDATAAGKAWPSPRTWEMSAITLAATRSVHADEDTESTLIAACVGQGAAYEFLQWEKTLDLPDPLVMLESPNLFKSPAQTDRLFACLTSIVTMAQTNLKKYWLPAWQILAQVATEGRTDIATIPAITLAKKGMKKYPVPEEVQAFLPLIEAMSE